LVHLVLHLTPQPPQFFLSVKVLTHLPSQQVWVYLHVLLQLPQCWKLCSVSTQVPLQHVAPGLPGSRQMDGGFLLQS
jgi:hypothetical protein